MDLIPANLPTLLFFSAFLFGSYAFYHVILRPTYFSPLIDVPAPARQSLIYGNLEEIFAGEAGEGQGKLVQAHGPVVRYGGFFGDDRLLITDAAALQHILVTSSYAYPKPSNVRGDLGRILGKGVLFAEGDDHRRQRKILIPAFSPSAINALVPTFFEMSYLLRDRWTSLITDSTIPDSDKIFRDASKAEEYQKNRKEGETVIEVASWFSRVTLDVIGLTGFGYNFQAMEGKSNSLADAFSQLASASGSNRMTAKSLLIGRILGSIISLIPAAKYIPNARLQAVRSAFSVMEKESLKIIAEKRKEVESAGELGTGKDLMTLLLKSSNADAKNQLSAEELVGQLTTFILAGHETSSTVLTWTMFTLATRPFIQSKLREEIRKARALASADGRAEMTPEELGALPYLDAVIREMLRFEPVVSATVRESSFDDQVPLSKPIKSPSGKMISSIPVPAGQVIFLPITTINMDTTIFGEDAEEFRPERWIEGKVGEKVAGVGVYSNMMTFLAGPRSCIGYKFAILEIKAILSVIIDDFQFELRDEKMEVERRSAIVMRPHVREEQEKGAMMPLRVSLATR